ncbi:hypothetical protein RFI_36004, partial [Reticulomyxa filosa]
VCKNQEIMQWLPNDGTSADSDLKNKKIYIPHGIKKKEIGFQNRIFLMKIKLAVLENFEIDMMKYINHYRSACIKAFEGNEKKVDELLHQLSQHGRKSYINCDVETSKTHQIHLQLQYLGLRV